MSFDKGEFYTSVRHGILGPTIEPKELEGCEASLAVMDGTPPAYCAYALATAFHETNGTMQPVREAYFLKGNAEAWRKAHLRYYPWYGRGFVQLTWQRNYQRADDDLHPPQGRPLYCHHAHQRTGSQAGRTGQGQARNPDPPTAAPAHRHRDQPGPGTATHHHC